jgi:hypothetical protein
MFHAKDGWFFERLEDGSVRIVKTDDGREPWGDPTWVSTERTSNVQQEAILPPETWASVIASLSPDREQNGSYDLALLLHRDGANALAKYVIREGT